MSPGFSTHGRRRQRVLGHDVERKDEERCPRRGREGGNACLHAPRARRRAGVRPLQWSEVPRRGYLGLGARQARPPRGARPRRADARESRQARGSVRSAEAGVLELARGTRRSSRSTASIARANARHSARCCCEPSRTGRASVGIRGGVGRRPFPSYSRRGLSARGDTGSGRSSPPRGRTRPRFARAGALDEPIAVRRRSSSTESSRKSTCPRSRSFTPKSIPRLSRYRRARRGTTAMRSPAETTSIEAP